MQFSGSVFAVTESVTVCVVGFSEKNVPSFDHDSVEEDRVETEIDNRERGLFNPPRDLCEGPS